MKVYISLPITGHPIEEVKQKAEKAKQKLTGMGYDVVSPLDLHKEYDKPYSYYMGKDIEALIDCDAVFFCSGWQESKGCTLEYHAARVYGKIFMKEN